MLNREAAAKRGSQEEWFSFLDRRFTGDILLLRWMHLPSRGNTLALHNPIFAVGGGVCKSFDKSEARFALQIQR